MLRSLRCLLVWCLMLALPVQSLAAAAMRSCHSTDAAPTLMVHAGHHQDAAAADTNDRCSACALCCLGAAWIPVPLAAPELPAAWDAVAMAPPAMRSFVPAGLERPPRSALLR